VYTVHHSDNDARQLWKKVAGVGDDRVLGLGDKDNFWTMARSVPAARAAKFTTTRGTTSPAPKLWPAALVLGPACDCDRWVEIWNLVFMQFEQLPDRTRRPLPKPSVDTGMGLERLCAVLGGFRSNYETDLLRPLIAEVEKPDGERPSHPRTTPAGSVAVSMRAIADHARAAAFLNRRRCVSRKNWSRIRPAPDHEARHLPQLAAGPAQWQPLPQAGVHGRGH